MLSISFIFLIIYTVHEFYNPFDDRIIERHVNLLQVLYEIAMIGYGILRIGLFVFNIMLSMNVYYLMKKLHNFEFERNKANMRLVIFLYWVNLTVLLFVYFAKFIDN